MDNSSYEEELMENDMAPNPTAEPVGKNDYQRTFIPEKRDNLISIAVIGTGNCGSMMADAVAEELHRDTIVINGCKKDLDLVSYVPDNCKFQVGDGKGTGKDRNVAKEFFLADSGLVMEKKFTDVIEQNDAIFVCTSTGGGYGSGSSTELLELLIEMYPEKIFVAVGVLPFEDEGYAAFNGTKAWLKEVLALHIRYMLYVNATPTNRITREQVALNVNRMFVKHLSVLQGDWIGATVTGGIDSRDMVTVLSPAGRIVVLTAEGLEVSEVKDNLIETLRSKVAENCNAELVNDGEIAASALMYELGSEFNEYKATIKQDLYNTFGDHIKDMSNFTDAEDGHEIALVMSGLTEPVMVIDRIITKLQKMGTGIMSRKSAISKLDKTEDMVNEKLAVTAKHSFATETPIVAAAKPNNASSKDEMLKRFLERKAQK